jgi:hypothetical protein
MEQNTGLSQRVFNKKALAHLEIYSEQKRGFRSPRLVHLGRDVMAMKKHAAKLQQKIHPTTGYSQIPCPLHRAVWR